MNSFIETLNQRGENFLNFAWPMFWQSSLLILILFTFDFLLRRKLRASIRYALWLIVLIKLILPPSFALPTNPIWWLHRTPPVVAKISQPNYTVTYDQNLPPEVSNPTRPAFVPPKPELTIASWLLAISICVSLALLFWMLARWRQVTKQVRRAQFSGRLTFLAAEAQKFGNFKFNFQPHVKLTANAMSPAVCGLFRPTILIPQTLAENFSDEQLRAVLLHELIHLRRGDVWLNFAQTLLQIFYWWHPLLWLANARIRRVREEAVDDAVMLALRDDAETYAPTLLEVAKLALNRPLVCLGLVGILESRHALRQRIERLLNFRAPKKVGLTFLSLCGIFIFSAVALPMGSAPTSPNENQIVSAPATEKISASNVPNTFAPKTNTPEILITTHLYQTRESDFEKISAPLRKIPSAETQNLDWLVAKSEASQIQNKLASIGGKEIATPRVVTLNGEPAHMSVVGPIFIISKSYMINGINFSCVPRMSNDMINLTISGQITGKKRDLMVTNYFDSKGLMENRGGFIFCFKETPKNNLVIFIKAEILTNTSQFKQRLEKIIKKNDVKLDSTNLFERVFKLDTNIFLVNLEKQTGLKTNVSLEARNFFGKTGVNWESPSGKSIFYNDGLGMLFVKATESDLDKIEREIQKLDFDPAQIKPQIHIKARFLQLTRGKSSDTNSNEWYWGNLNLSGTNIATGVTGILNHENLRVALRALESRKDVETLAEPECVTTSGRQVQMRATTIITVITNFAFQENVTNNRTSIFPQTTQVETGPILDVVPHVLADGYTINLTVNPTLLEFLGYDRPTNETTTAYTKNGVKVDVPVILPRFDIRHASANLNLFDGQTVVVGGMNSTSVLVTKDKVPVLGDIPLMGKLFQSQSKTTVEKELLVFITAEIVDPAGNRVHSDDEMPFATNGIPPADSSVNLYN